MSKMKKIGITLLILVLLVSGGGWFAYNKMTDYVIANMIENMLMENLDVQDILAEDGQTSPVQQTPEIQTNQTAETIPSNSQVDIGSNGASSTQGTGNQTARPTVSKTKADIQEQVKEVVKSIPTKDKSEVMGLVVKNISSSDIHKLSGLVTDGEISSSDMAEAKSIALRSFTEEQLEEVKNYYDQYIDLLSEFNK